MTYEVQGSDDPATFFVDTRLGLCSCQEGRTGAACPHQDAIRCHLKVGRPICPAGSAEERELLLKVPTRRECP